MATTCAKRGPFQPFGIDLQTRFRTESWLTLLFLDLGKSWCPFSFNSYPSYVALCVPRLLVYVLLVLSLAPWDRKSKDVL